MAIQPIVTFPQQVLRDKAKKVTKFDEELKNLVNDMAATMYDAPGVGLAAPQIGVSLQLTVIDTSRKKEAKEFIVLANPEIVKGEGEHVDEEGCLSVREYAANVKRYEKIWVKAQDINGEPLNFEAEGFFARIIQHELDHLNGTLFIDRLSTLKRALYKKKLKKILKAEEDE